MSQPPQTAASDLRREISKAVVHLYTEHLGKGPTECRTYLKPDLIIVVLSGGYSSAEQTLYQVGKWYEVRQVRQSWHDAMQLKFISEIERVTGRTVKAFMGANHQEPDLSVELFVLEPREDEPDDR